MIRVDYDMQLVGLKPVGEGLKVAQEKGFGYTNHEYPPFMKVR